jgi:hypothetical protein
MRCIKASFYSILTVLLPILQKIKNGMFID